MVTPQHHCLLVALFFPVFMAMPEPISDDNWEPPAETPPMPLSIPRLNGPGHLFYHNGDNTTGPPAGYLEAYCQLLLQVPVPSDQIPWFCLCSQCQNNHGPKGDRGDRGLPGIWHNIMVNLISFINKNETQLYLLFTKVILEVLEEEG